MEISLWRARCAHMEAGLRTIANGDFPLEEPPEGTSDAEHAAITISAIEAFAQSTLDEAPPA